MENHSVQSKVLTRRVQRATDKEEAIKILTQTPQSPFKEIWALMIFAAMLGFQEGRRVPLKAVDTGKGIDLRYFSNSPAWPGVVYLLALVDAEKADVLMGDPKMEEERTRLFEEYANGGLSILKDKLESSGYSLDSLCQLVASHVGTPGASENQLAQVSI
jgi:dnd system-associated protein 4